MQDQLAIFGWISIVIFAVTIVAPYLFRSSDLLTTWNLFLLGSINFVGYASVQSARGQYSYGLFTNDDVVRVMGGTIAFFVAAYLTYYRMPLPQKLAGRSMRHWPGFTGSALVIMLAACTGFAVVSVFFPNVQFVGQILIIVGPCTGIIAIALCLRRWWDNTSSLWLLALTCAFAILAVMAAIHGTTGRRALLSVLMVAPICIYWFWLRYKPLVYTVVPLVLGGFMVVVVLAGYTTIRHRYNAEQVNVTGRSSVQTAIESLKLLPSAILRFQGFDLLLGGDSMEAAMVSIQRYTTNQADPQPFFVVRYVLANPIPRALWPEETWGIKPEALGQTLPRDTGVWSRGYVNWGPGLAGHAFHEGGALLGGLGGYLFAVFYGVLYGSLMRYFDELLRRQPDNPFLLGVLAAASGQIIAFSRGDIGLFSVLIIGAVLAGLILKVIGRWTVGYRLVYPSDAERAAAEQQAAVAASLPPADRTHNGWHFGPTAVPTPQWARN